MQPYLLDLVRIGIMLAICLGLAGPLTWAERRQSAAIQDRVGPNRAALRFFGREVFSLSLVLPIALPGIVTGLALNASARTAGISFSTFTIVLGHATFCIVVVYNNVIARLRRSSRSIEEASMDLGADTWQTFRYITFPVIRTAVLAGGLLAFALSFDEIVVTTFTAGTQETIPIWIFNHLRQANQRPIVNVVALVLILLSTIPVYLASRLTTGTATSGRT